MQVRGQLFTLYLMYYDDESDLIHSEGLQGCGVQKWPYVVLRQFRLLHCALARFLSELSSFRQIHVVVSRGGGIHHFCDSQFTAIHNLTLTIRFNSIHVFWMLRGKSDSQGRFKIILALGSTIQVWFLQSYGKLDSYTFPRFIYEIQLQSAASTSPLHICLISSQPT